MCLVCSSASWAQILQLLLSTLLFKARNDTKVGPDFFWMSSTEKSRKSPDLLSRHLSGNPDAFTVEIVTYTCRTSLLIKVIFVPASRQEMAVTSLFLCWSVCVCMVARSFILNAVYDILLFAARCYA